MAGQTFVHCPIFPTAASRRSLVRVSVPVWGIILSDPLPIVVLVSRYLTNKLIGRMPICNRRSFKNKSCDSLILCGINPNFFDAIPQLQVGCIRVTHPFASLHSVQAQNIPLDLHVLGLPLAFILSQDQTLHSKKFLI
jgi:hypothetical protein